MKTLNFTTAILVMTIIFATRVNAQSTPSIINTIYFLTANTTGIQPYSGCRYDADRSNTNRYEKMTITGSRSKNHSLLCYLINTGKSIGNNNSKPNLP